jgi:hypothetical protein
MQAKSQQPLQLRRQALTVSSNSSGMSCHADVARSSCFSGTSEAGSTFAVHACSTAMPCSLRLYVNTHLIVLLTCLTGV